MKGQRFADLSDIQRNVKILLRGIQEKIFKTVSGSGTMRLTEVRSFTRRQQPVVYR